MIYVSSFFLGRRWISRWVEFCLRNVSLSSCQLSTIMRPKPWRCWRPFIGQGSLGPGWRVLSSSRALSMRKWMTGFVSHCRYIRNEIDDQWSTEHLKFKILQTDGHLNTCWKSRSQRTKWVVGTCSYIDRWRDWTHGWWKRYHEGATWRN